MINKAREADEKELEEREGLGGVGLHLVVWCRVGSGGVGSHLVSDW